MRIKFGRRGNAKSLPIARGASIARISQHLSQKSPAEPSEAERGKVTGADTDAVMKQNASLFLKVVNFDRSFLGWIGEPARDAFFHLRHQNAVAEMLPTFLGIVNRYNRPSACGRPSRMEDLAFWQGFSVRMHRCN